MDSLEPKKLALLRIWQILKDYSDYKHPLTQEDIAQRLEKDYGIVIERKAISRNISLLRESGVEIESGRSGCYLKEREFDDSELHLLIDSVLSSRHIPARYTKDIIERLCHLSNVYFKSSVKNIFSVNDWDKTENKALFYNIDMIDAAIEKGRQVHYDYNKYGTDHKLHKSSRQNVTPYQMILHNQRYYLMGYSEYWGNIVFHRVDHITNIEIIDEKAYPLREIPGYQNGIDYKSLSSSMPYMYTDKPVNIVFHADESIIDQIIDWFGMQTAFTQTNTPGVVSVSITASAKAMELWALQYASHVEVVWPASLRAQILKDLEEAAKKYSK